MDIMSFKQFLEEAFNQPYPYEWKMKSKTTWIGHAETKQGTLKLNIGNIKDGLWFIDFSLGYTIKKTGKGDQFRVFATVLKMIDDFLKIKPEVIQFSAEKESSSSRSNLYQRMVNKFASSHGYVPTIESHNGAKIFTLTRKDVA